MEEWKECKLVDVITFQRGYDLHSKNMVGNKYPVVGSNGIIGWHNEYTTEAPSITIGRSGNVGKPFLYNGKTWSHNTTLFIKEYKNAEPYFIYYFLKTLNLSHFAGGSAVPTLNRNHIHSLSIRLPPLSVQKKIAAVLSALDDKIELNRQINANLEQQAQAIFKNWFVDFEPFGGQMPAGWRVGKLSEILAEIETGKRENGGALSFGIPSIGAEKIENITYYDFSTEKYISQNFYQKMTKGKIKSGDVLLYKDGAYTGKSTMFLNDFPYKECAVNEHVFLLRTENRKYQCFLYLLISQKDIKTYLHTMASSKAAQPGLNKSELQSLDIIIPTNDVLDKFEKIIYPLFTSIIQGLEQSRTLAAIRDTLLPKLMSGEIDVSSVKV